VEKEKKSVSAQEHKGRSSGARGASRISDWRFQISNLRLRGCSFGFLFLTFGLIWVILCPENFMESMGIFVRDQWLVARGAEDGRI